MKQGRECGYHQPTSVNRNANSKWLAPSTGDGKKSKKHTSDPFAGTPLGTGLVNFKEGGALG